MQHFKKTTMTAKKITTIILLLFFWTSSFSADFYKSTTDLNVRSGPGTGYEVLFRSQYGDEVKVLSKSNGWYEVEYNGNIGYASSKYLKPTTTTETDSNTDSGNILSSAANNILLIGGGFIAFLFILAFLFKRSALKNYGSIIALLATFFYYVFGLFLNLIFISMLSSSAGAGFLLSFFTYILALVVGILSIIGFFKNVGIGIIVLSAIIALIDFSTGAIPGGIMASMALFGGILITIGYSQIKQTV